MRAQRVGSAQRARCDTMRAVEGERETPGRREAGRLAPRWAALAGAPKLSDVRLDEGAVVLRSPGELRLENARVRLTELSE